MGHGYPEWEPARIGARVAVKTGSRAASGAFRPMIVRATFLPASGRVRRRARRRPRLPFAGRTRGRIRLSLLLLVSLV
ncbi:hypothetical protein A8D95_06060 [Burkholderia cenocepacia]|uniref:Uncharacterized protein n=1 Tax=Burkholderia cenocepacia TaxID=95486 RepID=A0A1V2XJ06_9BURK|nr:hypothetical protein A8D61_13320 [Burkholderia cenocepacia]EPZ85789.1 hypothetical protein BURCENK562V_C5836 [Burkholderia cenocepacia K56-2Valvano]ERI28023.1 hypothetical protein BURCENBC7_AP5645 [Burkholderia cenocepacia BC7]CDN59345.1 hypothetical protein I35_0822 [Burkholderia cenocepacia H111]ONJ14551.1 hypothetical protein A8D83_08865 [Burkholderia cenocepacia]